MQQGPLAGAASAYKTLAASPVTSSKPYADTVDAFEAALQKEEQFAIVLHETAAHAVHMILISVAGCKTGADLERTWLQLPWHAVCVTAALDAERASCRPSTARSTI